MKKKYLLDRFVSLCYDYLFVIIVLGLSTFIIYIINKYFWNYDHIIIIIILFSILLYLFGYTLLSLILNGSFGKYLNDLYIEPTQGKITFGRVLFREIILKQLLYITILGLFIDLIFFIIKKDTLHDYYLKTKVVKK